MVGTQPQQQPQPQPQQAQGQGHSAASMSLYTNSPQMASNQQNNGGGLGSYAGQSSSVFNSGKNKTLCRDLVVY